MSKVWTFVRYSIFSLAVVLIVAPQIRSQSVLGKWKTIDDKTGETKSIVEIYRKGQGYFGRVTHVFPKKGEDSNPICNECDEDDTRYNKPITGMDIIRDMRWDDEELELVDGDILDPENGETYDAKVWVGEDGNLNVRGYVLFVYRTQQWLRVTD